jgi:hypothetical protein
MRASPTTVATAPSQRHAGPARHRHGHRALEADGDERRARQVERGEHEEGDRDPEMIGEPRRQEPAEEIAGDVAGDVGGKGAAHLGRRAMLRQVGHGQRERGCHEHALGDTQPRERGEVARQREQRRRDREQRQAHPDAAPPVDVPADQRDDDAGGGHAERAGVDRGAHLRRRRVEDGRERGQDRLRREQIDERQEADHADHGEAHPRALHAGGTQRARQRSGCGQHPSASLPRARQR